MTQGDSDWARSFELEGTEREDSIREALGIIEGWGLTMPPVDPLPLDFGLGDFRRIGETEWWIVNDTENGYCGKFLFLFEGQRCPEHCHRMKDETFYVVRGTIEMDLPNRSRTLRAGDVLKVSPGTSHSFLAVGGPALLLEVSLPSVPGDSVFADRRIGREGVI